MLPNDIKEYIKKHKDVGTAFEQVVNVLQERGIDEAGISEAAKLWYGSGKDIPQQQYSNSEPTKEVQANTAETPVKTEENANNVNEAPNTMDSKVKEEIVTEKTIEKPGEAKPETDVKDKKDIPITIKMDKPAITVGLVGEVAKPRKPLVIKPEQKQENTANKPTEAVNTTPQADSLDSLEVAHDALPLTIFLKKLVPILAITFIVGMLATPFLIAYQVIPTSNEVRGAVSRFVFAIPFLPKNPEYVLGSALLAHKNNPSGKIDLSIASSSADLQELFETNNFDMSVTGGFDYSDIDNKKMDLAIALGNNLSGNFRLINDKGYYKINDLPDLLTGMMLAENADISSILNVWVVKEYANIDSEARALLDEKQTSTDAQLKEFMNTVYIDKILPKVEMTSDNLEGNDTYKVHLSLNQAELKDVVAATKRISEPIPTKAVGPAVEAVAVDIWINKKDYFIKKVAISAIIGSQPIEANTETQTKVLGEADIKQMQATEEILPVLPSITQNKIDLAFVLNITSVGTKLEVTPPEKFITQEEFIGRLFDVLQGDSKQSLDYSQIKANVDIWSQAIDLYYEQNANYPASIEDVQALPKDGSVQVRNLTDNTGILLYLTIPEPEQENNLYFAIVKQNGTPGGAGTLYTAEELTGLTGTSELGLQTKTIVDEDNNDPDIPSPFGEI